MNTSFRRSSSFRIPGYSENAVLQLIVATGVGFILYHTARVTLIVFGVPPGESQAMLLPYIALPRLQEFPAHAWTMLTYGWAHNGFLEWLSNMVWLYTFGNVLQNLLGYRQVIPTYIYGVLLGAVFCLGVQFVPGLSLSSPYLITANAGVMALAAGTITMAPRYRFYIGEHFNIPLLVVFGIYLALHLLVHATNLPMLALDLGGMLAGFGMVTLLKRGFKPGAWMYQITDTIGNSMNPDNTKLQKMRQGRRQQTVQISRRQAEREVTQHRVDEILEKIHQKGVNSLTTEEREILQRAASKETQD